MCKDGGKAMPTFVHQVLDLIREVIETNHNNAILMDCNSGLIMDLNGSCAYEHLTCEKVQKANACVKVLNKHMEASDLKN